MSSFSLGRSAHAFTDTSAYFGLVDTRQSSHASLDAIRRRFERDRSQLFTANHIVAETHALMLIRLGYHVASRFLTELDDSPTTVLRVLEADEQRAREIITRYSDKAFSCTDATSFAVMERLSIDTAFTLDRNFAQFGFVVLPNL